MNENTTQAQLAGNTTVKKRLPRSLKACDRCKSKKQRCNMSPDISKDVRCLACQKIDTKCSLQDVLQSYVRGVDSDSDFEVGDDNEAGEINTSDIPTNNQGTIKDPQLDGNMALKRIVEKAKLEKSAKKVSKKRNNLDNKTLSTSLYTQHLVGSLSSSVLDQIDSKVSKILEYLQSNAQLQNLNDIQNVTAINALDMISPDGAFANAPSVQNLMKLPTTNTDDSSLDSKSSGGTPISREKYSSSDRFLSTPDENSTLANQFLSKRCDSPLTASRMNSNPLSDKTVAVNSDDQLCKPEPTFLFSPFATYSRLVQKSNMPLQIRNLHDSGPLDETAENGELNDVITSNILTLPEVIMLVREFKDNYGTWVSFPENVPVEDIVDSIRKSHCSVLLTTACVLALRYTVYYHDLKTRIYKSLLYKLKYDLETQIVMNDFSIELIQSLVMMSIYSSSLSSDIQTFDAWSLSGMGIQVFISHDILNVFKPPSAVSSSLGTENTESNYRPNVDKADQMLLDKLRNHRLWNHLVLCHLTHSVLSGRMSILNRRSLRICFDCLELPNATHFDGRMIAEISLYSILYEYGQKFGDVHDIKEPLSVIDAWYSKWKYLTAQPTEQFVDFKYHFGYVLMNYMWYHHKKFPSMSSQRKRQSKKTKEQETKEQSNFFNANGPNAQRTFNGEKMNKKFPLCDVFSLIPLETKKVMLNHCENGLRVIIDVRIHNFRYLSDQLIFVAVYLSLVTLKTLKNVCDEFPDELSSGYVKTMVGHVKQLSLKLRSIRESELKSFWVEEVDLRIPSVVLQYHSALESYLRETFPEMVDPARPL